MKTTTKTLTTILCITLIVACDDLDKFVNPQQPVTPAPKLEDRSKQAILDYFDQVVNDGYVVSGQHCGDGPDQTAAFYEDFIETLAVQTGKYVGIVGADFGYNPSVVYPVNTLVDHWNNGGLITVSWHADNPFVDGYEVRWNSVENKRSIDLLALLKDADDSDARSNYRTELDNIATTLLKLKEAGVTVIWRPFHEMNGDFFWWGIDDYSNNQTNEAAYVALWKDLYETLTVDYGLDNLIWTYAPMSSASWNADVLAYYPGSDYVDLVGVDYYGTVPDFPDYEELSTLNKTIVMAEAGPASESYGNWNEMDLVDVLKGKAAYFLQWHSWEGADVAIIDNLNADTMMNSTTTITRDEL